MHICNEKKNEEKNVKHPFEAHPLHEIQREQKMLNVIFFPMTVYKMTQEEKETFKINQVRLWEGKKIRKSGFLVEWDRRRKL